MSIQFASRFKLVADKLNDIAADKFGILLTRLFQKLHLKNERLFTKDEEVQLQSVFELSPEELSLVLDGLCYIFEQAAFQNVGPEPLYEQLQGAGVDDAHSKIIGRLWASERAEFIGKLKQRNIGAASLTGTDYHLNVMVGESNLTRLQEPTAIFEFTTTNPSSGPTATEKTSIEFSHPELSSFFSQLERVQQQLDGLSG
mmetsp:Transcript_21330/g.35935  ORF Transcript_21330/g.35935 Transcript_21330/m.35935 type:complete len:200 (+) Transcript_21330:114-713(+)